MNFLFPSFPIPKFFYWFFHMSINQEGDYAILAKGGKDAPLNLKEPSQILI